MQKNKFHRTKGYDGLVGINADTEIIIKIIKEIQTKKQYEKNISGVQH